MLNGSSKFYLHALARLSEYTIGSQVNECTIKVVCLNLSFGDKYITWSVVMAASTVVNSKTSEFIMVFKKN